MAGLPNKHIRKAIYDVIHNMDVNGVTFPCYTEQSSIANPSNYTLLSSQFNTTAQTKCEKGWTNDTEIQVIVRVPKNQGSKVLLDDAVDAVITELRDVQIALAAGMRINQRTIDVVQEFSDETTSHIVYRSVIRFQTRIT